MHSTTENGRAPRPWEALPAMGALLRDPNDTAQVFTIVQALSFGTVPRMLRRYRRTESGRRILAERRQLLPLLADRAALEAMPRESLAAAYLAFLDAEGITATGLVEASEAGFRGEPPDDEAMVLIADRMRDQHDLWHVVAGYRGDLIGEAALLAFTFAQTKNPGVALIVSLTRLMTRELPGASQVIRDGHRRGHRAAWLPSQDWEALLPRPLAEVRAELRLDEPPRYAPVYARDVEHTRFGAYRRAPASS